MDLSVTLPELRSSPALCAFVSRRVYPSAIGPHLRPPRIGAAPVSRSRSKRHPAKGVRFGR
jgi:hypothetical protein